MNQTEIKQLIAKQRKFFNTGITKDVAFRKIALTRLKNGIKVNEKKISEALMLDLGKSRAEGFMCEIGIVLSEISYMLKHINSYSKEKKILTPLANFPATSTIKPIPYGVTLVMSPWNYPFGLAIEPMVDAIAAGNTCIIKPSEYSPYTSQVIKEIIEECFEPEFIAVVNGGIEVNTLLLKEHFDYIFFTGNPTVGKIVMENAAKHLTPVTLELGGKSPCIIEKTANLKLAAKRIVFGKYLNCGQTCVAPDYILCDEEIKDAFIIELRKQINRQYGKSPLNNKKYGKIINAKHFTRLNNLIEPRKVIYGGKSDPKALKIEPTIMDKVNFMDKVMQEEIFGPILPIITYKSLNRMIKKLQKLPRPLAFYVFTSDVKLAKKIMNKVSFGGGCINDTIMHVTGSNMPFGGIGNSGMGAYHGKAGFDTFTHYQSIIDKKTWFDAPIRYQPYNSFMEFVARRFLR